VARPGRDVPEERRGRRLQRGLPRSPGRDPITVFHMEWARQLGFLAEHVWSPTYALSITTGGTRTLTVESEDRDAMHRLLEATRRALVAR